LFVNRSRQRIVRRSGTPGAVRPRQECGWPVPALAQAALIRQGRREARRRSAVYTSGDARQDTAAGRSPSTPDSAKVAADLAEIGRNRHKAFAIGGIGVLGAISQQDGMVARAAWIR
jgi:hypothetical protein